jgi:beta-phosphoglucomutase-like phosphatase (HAD superfamily)
MSGSATAVLLDVDGTLVDSNYLHTVCWREVSTQAGQDVPASRIHRAIGMGSDQLLDARPGSPKGQCGH